MGSITETTPIFYRLPKEDKSALPQLASKYRDLRLTGLKVSPASFSSTYDIEAAFPDAVWESRLQRPGFETFVCAASPAAAAASGASEGPWVAQLTVRGPLAYEDFRLPAESGQVDQPEAEVAAEERWQVLSLYVNPDFRGRGIANGICEEAFSWLLKTARRERERQLSSSADGAVAEGVVERLRLRTIIKSDNFASMAVFEKKLGFDRTGDATLAEALRANGDAVPEHVAQQEADGTIKRVGWIFTKVVDVKN
ncbi:hypothetical protein BX600DRAFT_515820 [Xylariales sp. PMI_506]|nr:hypothetical protein BX600DRAFT_515820 [Xylariales sp. PMI_506]